MLGYLSCHSWLHSQGHLLISNYPPTQPLLCRLVHRQRVCHCTSGSSNLQTKDHVRRCGVWLLHEVSAVGNASLRTCCLWKSPHKVLMLHPSNINLSLIQNPSGWSFLPRDTAWIYVVDEAKADAHASEGRINGLQCKGLCSLFLSFIYH